MELPLDGFDTFPLAAGVFYPFTLSPEIAALVAINALMLKRTRLAGMRQFGGAAKIEAARR